MCAMIAGVNSFRLLMSSMSDSDLYQALKRCKELGALTQIQAENSSLIAQVGAFHIIELYVRYSTRVTS